MNTRSFALAAGVALLAASPLALAPVMAQTGTTPGGASQITPMTPGTPATRAPSDMTGSVGSTGLFAPMTGTMTGWRASSLIGQSVYNRANERIGEVNELVVERDGRVSAAIIGVGGFLGIGERNVAVNFSAIQMNNDSNGAARAVIDIERNALREAPEFRRPENWTR
jgi:sporulation protein YlmC with PRC-barrel domain